MNFITILFTIISMFHVEQATAISPNELMTADGNIWAVYDELDEGADYIVTFDSNGTESIYDDIIVSVKG